MAGDQRERVDMGIAENYRRLREENPDNVTIVLACKTRTVEEALEAI